MRTGSAARSRVGAPPARAGQRACGVRPLVRRTEIGVVPHRGAGGQHVAERRAAQVRSPTPPIRVARGTRQSSRRDFVVVGEGTSSGHWSRRRRRWIVKSGGVEIGRVRRVERRSLPPTRQHHRPECRGHEGVTRTRAVHRLHEVVEATWVEEGARIAGQPAGEHRHLLQMLVATGRQAAVGAGDGLVGPAGEQQAVPADTVGGERERNVASPSGAAANPRELPRIGAHLGDDSGDAQPLRSGGRRTAMVRCVRRAASGSWKSDPARSHFRIAHAQCSERQRYHFGSAGRVVSPAVVSGVVDQLVDREVGEVVSQAPGRREQTEPG